MKAVLLLLLMLFGVAAPAAAQIPALATKQAAPAAPETVTPAQAQAVLDVLQNDQKRAQFIAVLQNIVKVQAATAPKAAGIPLTPGSLGAEVLQGASGALERAGADMLRTIRTLTSFRLFSAWLAHVAANPADRDLLIDAGWRLVLAAMIAGGAEYLTWRGLQRLRRGIVAAAPRQDDPASPQPGLGLEPGAPPRPSPWTLLRRIPYVLLRLLLDLTPIGVFAAIVYALLITPVGQSDTARPIVLVFAQAYVAFGTGVVLVRSMLAPNSAVLRLVHMTDASAAYLMRWTRRFLGVAMFGFAIDQIGLQFGMYPGVHDAFLKLLGLVLHVFALIVVLQCRGKVARRLRAPPGAHGAWALVRNRLADIWHIIAIFYIVAIWLIFAFEVRNGFAIVWRYFLVAAGVMAVARLIGIVLLGAVDRLLRVQPETAERFPGLDLRASRYQPLLRRLINWLLTLIALLVLLRMWGVPVDLWVRGGTLGARLLAALGTSLLVVAIAIAVWEGVNAAIEAHLARLARQAQLARSARLRTLLPMLRTALLAIILVFATLMVLSQIGVNTAPLLAGAGVVGIAIGFGSQKLVQDVITGLFLLLENTMQVGDVVALASLSGTVETLSIRTIRLRATDGSVHVIPFSAVTTVTNSTRDYGYAVLDVTAGYNEEPDHIADLLREIAIELRADPRWRDAIEGDIDVWGVDKFLDNAWVLRARIKTTATQRWAVQREFNRRLKYRFDRLAIESPFTSPRCLSNNPPMPATAPEPEPKTPPTPELP